MHRAMLIAVTIVESMKLRHLLPILALAHVPLSSAQAPAWKPARSVEIVVGVGPGGGIDRTARVVQKILQDEKLIDVPASVVNRPGGGGTIAQAALNQRQGDAHVWEITATSLLTNHITGRSVLG